jgi:hypothetical protein
LRKDFNLRRGKRERVLAALLVTMGLPSSPLFFKEEQYGINHYKE